METKKQKEKEGRLGDRSNVQTDSTLNSTDELINCHTARITYFQTEQGERELSVSTSHSGPHVTRSELSRPADIHVGRFVKLVIIVRLLSSILTFFSLSSSFALSSCFCTQVCCFSLGFSSACQ